MAKRRYTIEEIYEMKTQIFEDSHAERSKYMLIAEWVEKKARMHARVEFTEYGGNIENPHIPFYFISIPVSSYNSLSPWIEDCIQGPGKCKPPAPGINIHSLGWMLDADIPDVGKVNVYVCVSNAKTVEF